MSGLNQGQQQAADAFFEFLFTKDKEFGISGPGGVGKTHLMSHMIDVIMPRYQDTCKLLGVDVQYDSVEMTATTNKAAGVVAVATQRPTSTLASFLNLKVQDDYSTGQSKLTKTNNWRVHERKIVFVDEVSMIDTPLDNMLSEGTHDCKIVFVGDHCQLAPIMEPISPIYRRSMPFYELTEPMRTDNPALLAINQQLRETVETGVFRPIKIVPGVIDHLDDTAMQAALAETFTEQNYNSRILAYTNNRVVDFNDHIRDMRGLTPEFTTGEFLVNNNAIRLKNSMLSVEEEVTILAQNSSIEEMVVDVDEHNQPVVLKIRRSTIESRVGNVWTDVPLPVDRLHFTQLVAYYGRKKNWPKYFDLKSRIPDLRQRDAATFHKSQGSTYDTVFIDLGNLSTCHQPNQAARMLYVGLSRARHRVYLFGNLAAKYGGLTR